MLWFALTTDTQTQKHTPTLTHTHTHGGRACVLWLLKRLCRLSERGFVHSAFQVNVGTKTNHFSRTITVPAPPWLLVTMVLVIGVLHFSLPGCVHSTWTLQEECYYLWFIQVAQQEKWLFLPLKPFLGLQPFSCVERTLANTSVWTWTSTHPVKTTAWPRGEEEPGRGSWRLREISGTCKHCCWQI